MELLPMLIVELHTAKKKLGKILLMPDNCALSPEMQFPTTNLSSLHTRTH
jgi:hypothetical protein